MARGRRRLKFLYFINWLMVATTGILVSLYFRNRLGLILSCFVWVSTLLFFFIQSTFAKIFQIKGLEKPVEKDEPVENPQFFALLACLAFCFFICFYMYHLLEGTNISQLLLEVLEVG